MHESAGNLLQGQGLPPCFPNNALCQTSHGNNEGSIDDLVCPHFAETSFVHWEESLLLAAEPSLVLQTLYSFCYLGSLNGYQLYKGKEDFSFLLYTFVGGHWTLTQQLEN